MAAAIDQVARGAVEEGLAALETALATMSTGDLRSRLEARRWAAHALARLERPEEALAHLDAALALAPGDPWLHYERGAILHETGSYEAAIQACEHALALDPRHFKAAQFRGECLALLRRHAEADAAFGAALAILAEADPGALASWGGERAALEARTLLARADVRDALGDHAAARADRERARTLAATR